MFIRQIKAIKLAEKDGVKKLQDTAGEIYYEKDGVYYEENPNTNPVELSRRRAASVLNYLVSKGEGGLAERASSKGYGETSPLPGVSPSDAKNRRVEIKVFRSK